MYESPFLVLWSIDLDLARIKLFSVSGEFIFKYKGNKIVSGLLDRA